MLLNTLLEILSIERKKKALMVKIFVLRICVRLLLTEQSLCH
jgi:hypothetical protein